MKATIKTVFASGVLAAACMAAPPALADSFQGTVWSLNYSGVALPDADPLHETYRVTLGVDTDGYTGTGSFLDQVALKVSSSIYSASLFNAPGGAGSWTLASGGISASGCSGSGSGFECADSTLALNGGKGVALKPGTPGVDYEWVFDIAMDNGTLFTGAGLSSVKGRFVDTNGLKVGALVSEPATLTPPPPPVPEPETYALLMAGLGLMGAMARRRRQSGDSA